MNFHGTMLYSGEENCEICTPSLLFNVDCKFAFFNAGQHLLRKIPKFHLIFWYGNFVERHGFCIISGEWPEAMRKLPFHKICTTWNSVKLCYFTQWLSEMGFPGLTQYLVREEGIFLSLQSKFNLFLVLSYENIKSLSYICHRL